MRTPARIIIFCIAALFAASLCRGSISYTCLDEPIVLFTDTSTYYESLDINNDTIVDFTFGVDVSSVGVHPENVNQYLIYPSPPPNIGGPVEPLPDGFEIGPNSGEGQLDWYGSIGYSTLIRCLSGAGGDICAGRFVGQRAYMGVEFDIGGTTHYGWFDLHVAEYSPGAEIYGWAYETDPMVSIIAGAVPEPSSALFFVIGVMVLFFARMKKKLVLRNPRK